MQDTPEVKETLADALLSPSLGAKLCPTVPPPWRGGFRWGGKPRLLTPTQTLPVEEEGTMPQVKA